MERLTVWQAEVSESRVGREEWIAGIFLEKSSNGSCSNVLTIRLVDGIRDGECFVVDGRQNGITKLVLWRHVSLR
jgi:hypothetical protein